MLRYKVAFLARRLWLPSALAVGIALLYWPSLSLPLSFDDAWSVRLVRDFTFVDLFTRTQNFGYYRPIYLAYYKLATLVGPYGPMLLHTLCIAAHAVNALLLLKFIPTTLGRRTAGLAFSAAFLFALNPFAVQAVALPAGLNHLLALLFIQLAVLAYARARQPASTYRRALRWVGCLGLCALAFLSNEIGLSVVGFVLAYEAARLGQARCWPLAAARAWPVIGLAVGYVVVYSLIPKGAAPEFVFSIEGMLIRALTALQTLTYPLTWLVAPLRLSAEVSVLVASILLTVACLLALRNHESGALLAGALIFAASVALPVLRLATGYVQNAPRIFYVSSVGTAMLWAWLVRALSAQLGHSLDRAAMAAAIAAIGLAGAWHAREHQSFLARANEPVSAIARAGAALAPDETLLAINAPEWVAPPRRRFPMFHEGAIVLADYVTGSDLVLANTGLIRGVQLAQLALPHDPTRPYAFQPFGDLLDFAQLHNAALVLQTHYRPDGPRTAWIGGATAQQHAQVEVSFAGGLALVRHDIQPCREGWVASLQWRGASSARELTPTLSAFVQVLDANGAKLTQNDGAPLDGLLLFTQMPRDRDIVDRRMLTAPGAVGATLYIGLYDYTTGERLPATDARGARLDGDALALALPPLDPSIACW
ncbi:MAG: hypothetical protein ACK4JD_03150 [Thermoflexales bacterium]